MDQIKASSPCGTTAGTLSLIDNIETLLIGDIGSNLNLINLHSEVVKKLTYAYAYDNYFDLVTSAYSTHPSDTLDALELAEADALYNSIQQVIYFDTGSESEFDMGVRLAPFIHAGAKCVILTDCLDSDYLIINHKLVTVHCFN